MVLYTFLYAKNTAQDRGPPTIRKGTSGGLVAVARDRHLFGVSSTSRRRVSVRRTASAVSTRPGRPTQVYGQLRALIVQGKLAPGSRIIETDIAERLGVSRTPVREALQRLQQEGYVVGAPLAHQSRLTVAPLTKQDVRELLNIVGTLEGLAAFGAAERTAGDRATLARALRALNADFRRAAEAHPTDHNRVYDFDEAFHQRLVEDGAGARLRSLHEAVKPQAERYIRMYISLLVGDIRPSVDEHEVIIRAVRDGDADGAQHAVQTNWRHAAERLGRVIEVAGERGSW
jgi:DNA-binding GntR family transcriptional regulator